MNPQKIMSLKNHETWRKIINQKILRKSLNMKMKIQKITKQKMLRPEDLKIKRSWNSKIRKEENQKITLK